MSRTVVNPAISVTRAFRAPHSASSAGVVLRSASSQRTSLRPVRWVWRSINPGSKVAVPRSISAAPGGMGRLVPTAAILSPSIRTIAGAIDAPPRPSISRAARITVTAGAWATCTKIAATYSPRVIMTVLRGLGGMRGTMPSDAHRCKACGSDHGTRGASVLPATAPGYACSLGGAARREGRTVARPELRCGRWTDRRSHRSSSEIDDHGSIHRAIPDIADGCVDILPRVQSQSPIGLMDMTEDMKRDVR